MINGIGTYPVEGDFFPGMHYGSGQFRPNGSGAVTILQGSLQDLYTVARTGAGLYTVTLDKKLKFPVSPCISVSTICADGTTNCFQAVLIGAWNNANHLFVVGTLKANTLTDFPSDPNNWVVFEVSMQTKVHK